MSLWTLFRSRRGHRPESTDTSRSDGRDRGVPTTAADGASPDQRVDPSVIRPVDRRRIEEWLRENKFHFFIDVDGDLGGTWRSCMFFFFLFGEDEEILQIRSQWNRQVTIERLDEILPFCNDWNTERIWPKTYVRVQDDGMVHVIAEVSVDLEMGVNDDQLAQQLICGLNSQNHFFDALEAFYPDPARRAR